MNKISEGYSIAIPAYGRPNEYDELLTSIFEMDFLPNEIIICEDFSKERVAIGEITARHRSQFEENNVKITYIENESNLGYDANIRKLIDKALHKWVILIGNDDLFLKNGLQEIDLFCQKNPDVAMVSRPFVRFEKDITKPLGISSVLPTETIIKKGDSPKLIFRMCGFVGGLVINKGWAQPLATTKYDGTLYYQIYLAANAFCTSGIGYLAKPSVGGRAGNSPLFGDSEKDGAAHIPGAYSAKGRAKMWKGVLDIAKDTEQLYKIEIAESLRQELMVRQSFHVFEMNVGVPNKTLNELKTELKKLNLFNHWLPKTLYNLNLIFGKNAYYFYYLIRKFAQ
ncbi:glycosyltransferase [Flavobacterium sp. GA093]|uniref:Glycosyltransferase n=1 Tax=Flavobacterium hydrocarbonoxydans TaxID=2683249 RepID=A0A6I4NRN8_9FLAO|nr:glycosyltransferase family 2 protein [Flavobacterium hydrocarbonoxydans]MWB93804.1 glycosyltransferase [Flavobacterium hydrocarbonoxydans]